MGFFDLFQKKETATELKRRVLELEKSGRHAEAADCHRKLAEMGDTYGMLMYAMYLDDCKQYAEAANWARKLALMGDARGMLLYATNLAKCDKYTEAANWARKSAEMGDAHGMLLYATYLRDGKGVQKDMQQSMVWLQKSADAGCTPAKKALATCKKNEALVQLKQALDLKKCGKLEEAASCFKRAAELGDARGMFFYASCLGDGEGVPQDLQQRIVWLQRSADAGYDGAQILLAQRYYSGLGVEKDIKKGFALMKKAAESGNVNAQRELGLMHLDGVLYGNETMKALGADVATALEWFEKAGNQGDAEAQYQMGFLLGAGADGDPQLMKESYDWLAKAADQGHEKAIKMCEDILAIIEGE